MALVKFEWVVSLGLDKLRIWIQMLVTKSKRMHMGMPCCFYHKGDYVKAKC